MITVAVICAGAIFLMLFADQISARRRVRRTTTDEQALNASIRRHPSSKPAHIPGQRRPS